MPDRLRIVRERRRRCRQFYDLDWRFRQRSFGLESVLKADRAPRRMAILCLDGSGRPGILIFAIGFSMLFSTLFRPAMAGLIFSATTAGASMPEWNALTDQQQTLWSQTVAIVLGNAFTNDYTVLRKLSLENNA